MLYLNIPNTMNILPSMLHAFSSRISIHVPRSPVLVKIQLVIMTRATTALKMLTK